MKCVLKGREPNTLASYRNAVPVATWAQLKDDARYAGRDAYSDCRSELLIQQGGLCAYCEIDIRDNDPLKCRVEHFHPKSDVSSQHNWALDWQNMLAVCNGGSYRHIAVGGFYLEPMNENLSCDAYKDRMIQSGKLPAQCDGWILNPIQLSAFPVLFALEKHTGKLFPNPVTCSNPLSLINNQHATVEVLVQHTIDMLNLNCERLTTARLLIVRDIENSKKKHRLAGFSSQQGLGNLAQRYFQYRWTAFFSTIRLCLGQAAEDYLQSIHYQG